LEPCQGKGAIKELIFFLFCNGYEIKECPTGFAFAILIFLCNQPLFPGKKISLCRFKGRLPAAEKYT
jgi:hypothetical protein